MDKLPLKSVTGSSFTVHSKKFIGLANNDERITNYQSGFASQLLLVLLLAGGIAAGTFLVQQRTNLKPQAAELIQCTPEQYSCEFSATSPIYTFTRCETIDNATGKIDLTDDNREACESRQFLASQQSPRKKTVIIYCTQNPPQCPAKTQGPTLSTEADTIPWLTNKECNDVQKNKCKNPSEPKDGCAVDYGGNGWCLYEQRRNGEKCNDDTHGATCRRIWGAGTECVIIDRVPRCVVNKCNAADIASCGDTSTCTPGRKKIGDKTYDYTYCGPKTSGPAPVAQQPPAAPAARGPAGGQPAGPAAPGGAKSAPAGGAPGGITGGKTEPVCGKNSDGIDIPCYKIGTIDEDTEAQLKDLAATSLLRYNQYTDVLNKIGKFIEDLKAKVDAKNKAAQSAAQACTNTPPAP